MWLLLALVARVCCDLWWLDAQNAFGGRNVEINARAGGGAVLPALGAGRLVAQEPGRGGGQEAGAGQGRPASVEQKQKANRLLQGENARKGQGRETSGGKGQATVKQTKAKSGLQQSLAYKQYRVQCRRTGAAYHTGTAGPASHTSTGYTGCPGSPGNQEKEQGKSLRKIKTHITLKVQCPLSSALTGIGSILNRPDSHVQH